MRLQGHVENISASVRQIHPPDCLQLQCQAGGSFGHSGEEAWFGSRPVDDLGSRHGVVRPGLGVFDDHVKRARGLVGHYQHHARSRAHSLLHDLGDGLLRCHVTIVDPHALRQVPVAPRGDDAFHAVLRDGAERPEECDKGSLGGSHGEDLRAELGVDPAPGGAVPPRDEQVGLLVRPCRHSDAFEPGGLRGWRGSNPHPNDERRLVKGGAVEEEKLVEAGTCSSHSVFGQKAHADLGHV
mmetsp:Transcript_72159/g.150750  ORF Transcript_72159/g.150750 Transcript_72159/m.150750 type:complete len:240 (-) Transcript_72159:849-1568(-)